jgi:glucoamylase
VALSGQDGFGTDDARGFTATPGGYTFGVCSAAQAAQNPEPQACQVSPSIEPKVMDTVPPPGVSLASELNVLANPVQLQGVTIP